MQQTSGIVGVRFPSTRCVLQMGYLTQRFSLYDMSIAENLRYAAGLREVSDAAFKTRSDHFSLLDLARSKNACRSPLRG